MNTHYDLIVAGGGMAGVGAALSAAREGLSVLLFDKHNCLGGAAVGALVNPFMPYWTEDPVTNERVYIIKGIFAEIREQLMTIAPGVMPDDAYFNEEYLKLILNRLLLETGVTLLFHSYLIDTDVVDGVVKSVTVANKSGKQTFTAPLFIDATGDGDLAVMAGCPYHLGRDSDHLCQPMTLCFRIANVDMPRYHQQFDAFQALYKEYLAAGKLRNIRENILVFTPPVKGVLHFNSTRIIKHCPVDAAEVTAAEIEAREQAFELFHFLKDHFDAFRDSEMLMTAAEIGVRESRMIEGDYCLTQEDLIACTHFEDGITRGNYDIDIHNPAGSDTSHYYFAPGEYYTIPYRCLTPRNTRNLLVAGRCISSTHEAQASYRIMPICCNIGEAAGTAAAMALEKGGDVRAVDVQRLRDRLTENGMLV